MAFLESQFHFKEAEGKTIITQEFWYRLKAPMGWLSGLMKGKMKSTLEGGLIGLEKYLNNSYGSKSLQIKPHSSNCFTILVL